MTKVKTIDITAKEWLDRPNGNRYFTAKVTVNYKMKGEKTFKIPYTNGHNDQYQVEAMKKLSSEGVIKSTEKDFELVPWRYAQDHGIIIRCHKQEKCTLKEIKDFVK